MNHKTPSGEIILQVIGSDQIRYMEKPRVTPDGLAEQVERFNTMPLEKAAAAIMKLSPGLTAFTVDQDSAFLHLSSEEQDAAVGYYYAKYLLKEYMLAGVPNTDPAVKLLIDAVWTIDHRVLGMRLALASSR